MNQLFYASHIEHGFARLDEEESRHLLTVLRYKVGDRLQLTDGRGFFYEAELAEAGKRQAAVRVVHTTPAPVPAARLHLAIAPTKQLERLEWCLEKATEIGVSEISLLRCQRSERDVVRLDRLEKVVLSAMKQSLRAWLPRLNGLTPFREVIAAAAETQKRIAWCAATPLPLLQNTLRTNESTLIAIGPEGDFSPAEIAWAEEHGFQGISLGPSRLRTETAGVLAVAAFNLLLSR